MIQRLERSVIESIIKDDPVRPHISAEWRDSNGSEVFGLWDEDFTCLRSIVCVHYMDAVPVNEESMIASGNTIAVFYTVWSYEKGAGREIIFSVADYIKQTRPTVKRYVTLSPLTDMAEQFHLRNGAELIAKHEYCQNFEYKL
jgi:hypothetical protein